MDNPSVLDALVAYRGMALTTRRSLACTCHAWSKHMRAYVATLTELFLREGDATRADVRFYSQHLLRRPIPVMVYPEGEVPFDKLNDKKLARLAGFPEGAVRFFPLGPITAFFVGRILVSYNLLVDAFVRGRMINLMNVANEGRYRVTARKAARMAPVTKNEWTLLAGAFEHNAQTKIDLAVWEHEECLRLGQLNRHPLILSELYLDEEAAEALGSKVRAMGNDGALSDLRLEFCGTQHGTGIVSPILNTRGSVFRNLYSLCLESNPMQSIDWHNFWLGVRAGAFPALVRLDVESCYIDSFNMSIVAKIVRGLSSKLCTLNLAKNPIGSNGLEDLIDQLPLFSGETCWQLSYLDLSLTGICTNGFARLAACIRSGRLPNLREVRMFDDWFSGSSEMEKMKKQRYDESRQIMDKALVYTRDPSMEYDTSASPEDYTLQCTAGCTAKKRCDFVEDEGGHWDFMQVLCG